MLYIGADGFDQVNLWSVVMTDANFDFEESFNEADKEVTVSEIKVDYMTKEEVGMGKQEIQAKFTYEAIDYYLELTTAGEVETKIEQYVTMLIG
jgi:hypothetical protein